MTTVRRWRGSFVAEGREFSDVTAGTTFGFDTAGVVIRAEVLWFDPDPKSKIRTEHPGDRL